MSYTTELTSKVVKGRKEYSCIWCGEKIEKGELHHYRTYIHEGELMTDRSHRECSEAAGKMTQKHWDEIGDDGFCEGEFKRGSIERRGEND
jgi:hypothetical protein